ncbi:MAG: restriction endonuclease subunit S, partial [Rhodocyclaceae bacterium]|nr:restriction endonuclease subunit S [Rhodocyclaceae bacterium]
MQEASAVYAVEHALLKSFDLLASAPDGVARLRELILSLAVQGKLLPQNANDEPASVLLERIRAEKQALIKAGKLKKDKSLAEIAEEEKPFELPQGWEWVALSDLAMPQAGFAFKATQFNEIKAGLPLIRIRDVGANDPATFYSGEFRDEFLVSAGDWLISMDGEFRVCPWSGPTALLNQRVSRLLFYSAETEQKLVCYALQFELRKLQGKKAYTTVDHLSGGQIATRAIPFPPLAEQSRIVARVEELMQLCDALEQQGRLEAAQHARLVGTLFDALANSESAHALAENWQRVAASFDLLLDRPEAVDALEQTLLQLAVRGLLVPQDPKDEPA